MAIRTILYGYRVENGKNIICIEEAEVVKKVFSLYIEGRSFDGIAKLLTENEIVYFQNEVKWNKNTVKRMIENEKYVGNEIYPMIVSTSVFNQAKAVRDKKSRKQERHSREVELLREICVCGKCGSRYKRVNTWGTREKWMCSNGCSCLVYIDDATLVKSVTDNFNRVTKDPELLNVSVSSQYQPTKEAVKEENELYRLLEQPKLDFKRVADCIMTGAKTRFTFCKFDEGEITDVLKDDISSCSLIGKITYTEMKEYIRQVMIQPDGRIITVYVNNAKITANGGFEYAS